MCYEQLREDDVGEGRVVGLMGYMWFVWEMMWMYDSNEELGFRSFR